MPQLDADGHALGMDGVDEAREVGDEAVVVQPQPTFTSLMESCSVPEFVIFSVVFKGESVGLTLPQSCVSPPSTVSFGCAYAVASAQKATAANVTNFLIKNSF